MWSGGGFEMNLEIGTQNEFDVAYLAAAINELEGSISKGEGLAEGSSA